MRNLRFSFITNSSSQQSVKGSLDSSPNNNLTTDDQLQAVRMNSLSKLRFFTSALALALTLAQIFALAGCTSKGLGKGKGSTVGAMGQDGEISEYDLQAQQEERFKDGNIPQAEAGGGLFRDIYFDYDSSSISPEAQQDIAANAAVLKENPSLSIQLEGHCDKRGTEEYNLALGDYRAKAVRDALTALGITNNQIQTISYGENIPLDPSDSDFSHAQNRRVHFAAGGAVANQKQAAYEGGVVTDSTSNYNAASTQTEYPPRGRMGEDSY